MPALMVNQMLIVVTRSLSLTLPRITDTMPHGWCPSPRCTGRRRRCWKPSSGRRA
ncbi:unnamed protein product, partial [Heterosigma akashiwo]